MVRRIFLAIHVPEKTKEELLSFKEALPALPATWTEKENLHLTLLFLGNTSAKELEDLMEKAKEVARAHKPFTLRFSRISYGPNNKTPRMIWAFGEPCKELSALQKDLEKNIGRREDIKPFAPHLTIARLQEQEFRLLDPEERPLIEEESTAIIPVASFDIMESKLKRDGAEYTLINTIPLSA